MSYEIIKQAINDRKPVYAVYDGKHRELCPHVLGMKNGKLQALFYQFGGESRSRPIRPDGSSENWRCLELSKLSDVRVVDGQWHTAPNHTRPQTCVDEVHAVVTY